MSIGAARRPVPSACPRTSPPLLSPSGRTLGTPAPLRPRTSRGGGYPFTPDTRVSATPTPPPSCVSSSVSPLRPPPLFLRPLFRPPASPLAGGSLPPASPVAKLPCRSDSISSDPAAVCPPQVLVLSVVVSCPPPLPLPPRTLVCSRFPSGNSRPPRRTAFLSYSVPLAKPPLSIPLSFSVSLSSLRFCIRPPSLPFLTLACLYFILFYFILFYSVCWGGGVLDTVARLHRSPRVYTMILTLVPPSPASCLGEHPRSRPPSLLHRARTFVRSTITTSLLGL